MSEQLRKKVKMAAIIGDQAQQERSEQKVKVQVDHLDQKMDRQHTDFQQRLTEQDLTQRQEKEVSKTLFDEQQQHLEQVAQTQDQALKELRDISAAHKENVTQRMRENEDKFNNMSRSLDDRLNEQSRILENKHRALELQLHKLNEVQAQLQQSVQQQQGTFEWRLKELADKYEHQLHARERQILMLEKRYRELQLHEKLQVQKSAATKPHQSNQCPPYDIVISDFEDKKAKREVVKSPPMYTHPGGYKFVVGLWPHGVRDGNGTYLSVVVYSEHGPFDDQLKWPAKVTISLQLVNEYRDSDHYSRDIECKTDREKVGRGISFGSNRCFIPHADLDWNHDNKTQYLKDNSLHFRVTKVIVHSS